MNDVNMLRVPPIIAAAIEVMCGVHGNDSARVKSLIAAGYDADRVQQCVNEFAHIWNKYKE